ncbi:hypothetical protein A7W90_16270 [Clostridium sp. Bc-iso-3]|nr:hypothetical protein A7W90_16270 [Clostridium sp. Bc-iso-3]
MTYALEGELHIATKEEAKALFEKLASIADTALRDKRDRITLGRDSTGIVLSFDLRFESETQRNNIRDWLVERQLHAIKGAIYEHTCKDDEGLPCADNVEVARWGWEDE